MIEQDALSKMIEKFAKEVVDGKSDPIGRDETFNDYGIDSLDQMNLLFEIESEFDVSLEKIDIAEVNTINKLFKELS